MHSGFCLFTPSYLHHFVSDMTGEAVLHIHQFIMQSEASSINKPVVCCVCGKFSLKQDPATWERRFTAKSATNINAEKEQTEETNRALPFVAAHTPRCNPRVCAAMICSYRILMWRLSGWITQGK